ncbi:MAG: PHD finger domain-containing protein, partial [Candidatus Thermoplasmatota archaeon]
MKGRMDKSLDVEISFAFRLFFITITALFLFLSFWAPFFANGGIAEARTFLSREEDIPSREDEVTSVAAWEQWSQSDFKKGDNQNLDLDSTPGKVKLDTDTIQIGAAEAAEQDSRGGYYYWPSGSTFLGCRDDFRAERGGTIREFKLNVGDDPDLAGAMKLKVLRPTDPGNVEPGQNAEFFASETEEFSPTHGELNEWDGLDIPIEKEDRLGLYTLGDLAAVAMTGQNGYWSYEGEITSTPREMGHISEDDAITTMEAEVETHRDEGVLESNVHNAGAHMYEWEQISWSADVPQGSSLTMETRTSPNGQNWTGWTEAENEGEVPGNDTHQYIQYRATFTSDTGKETPVLDSVRIEYRVDEAPPEINHDPIEEWQAEGNYTITAEVLDGGSGLAENPLLYYSIDAGGSWTELSMADIGGNLYEADIPDLEHSTEAMYYIEARNNAGLTATSPDDGHYYTFTVDKEPPDTEVVLTGEEGDNDWFVSQVEVELEAEDGLSGVDYTEYRKDGNEWRGYSGPIILENSGVHEIEYYSADNLGNEEPVNSVEVKIDLDPPAVELIKPEPSGENDWYLEEVDLELSAEDENSDVDRIEYRINERDWHAYDAPITLNESGTNLFEYRSFDEAGNEERYNTEIKMDMDDPSVTAEINGEEGSEGWYLSAAEVELGAEDAVSGVSQIYYRTQEADEWIEYGGTFQLESGRHLLEYYSVDKAGRESDLQEKEVKVDQSSPDLNFEAEPPHDQGWIDTSGTVEVEGQDALSGVSVLSCRINKGGEWENETHVNSGDLSEMNMTLDVDMSGALEVELFVEDVAGNNYVERFDYLIDLGNPIVDSSDASATVWRNDLTISVEASDYNSGIDQIILEYDTGDGWKEKEMTEGEGAYTATIPGNEVGFSDVNYRIVVRDGAGNVHETETKVAEVGINWWYFSPIPIAIVLVGLFVYLKKRREEQEKLMPVKESKFSKIKEQRSEKLKELESEREERPSTIDTGSAEAGSSTSAPPKAPDKMIGGVSSGPKSTSEQICSICSSPTDPESGLTCECGNAYHKDCLMVEGACPECGKDYAAVISFTEGQSEEEAVEVEEQTKEEEQEVEEETEEEEEMKECPLCETEVSAETEECPSCGETLIEESEEETVEEGEGEEIREEDETEEDDPDIKILADKTSTESEEKVKKEAEEMKEKAIGDQKADKEEDEEGNEEEETGEVEELLECPVCNNEVEP